MKSNQIWKKKNCWIYLRVDENQKFSVDEKDIQIFSHAGREEAYELCNDKMKTLDISYNDLGNWILEYFNRKIQPNLKQYY